MNQSLDSSPVIKNYAESEALRQRVTREFFPLLKQIRTERAPLEADWKAFFDVWDLVGGLEGYQGRSNIFVPAGHKVIETLVSQLVSQAFPGDELFSTDGVDPDDKMGANVRALVHLRMKRARVRMFAEPFFRSLCTFGNAPGRVLWYTRAYQGKVRKPKQDRAMEATAESILFGELASHEYTRFDGPLFQPVDIFNFYAWPETANSLDDCLVVFEDIETTKGQLLREASKGRYLKSEVMRVQPMSSKPGTAAPLTESQGYTGDGGSVSKTFSKMWITELYIEFDPDSARLEDDKNIRPMLVTLTADGCVLRIIESPMLDGRPPYVLGRMGTVTGRLYGEGFMKKIHDLNILLNDQVNQSMDVGTWSLNPFIVANPDNLYEPLGDMEPGMQVLARDVTTALKLERPPVDMALASSQLSGQTMSWIQDFGGAPPVLSGGSAPGRAFRSATGVGAAQRNAVIPLREIVRVTEVEVWEPVAEMFWMLDQQYPSIVKGLVGIGGDTVETEVDTMNMGGEYRFQWMASSQAENQQVKSQQLQQAIQLFSSPPIIEALRRNGMRANIQPLIERLLRDGFGLRGLEKVLLPEQGDPTAAQQALQQPMHQPSEVSLNLNGQTEDFSGDVTNARLVANPMSAMMGAGVVE